MSSPAFVCRLLTTIAGLLQLLLLLRISRTTTTATQLDVHSPQVVSAISVRRELMHNGVSVFAACDIRNYLSANVVLIN